MIKPKIAIIILNWNGFEDTCECLESVFDLDYKNYFVIVVDNNSDNQESQKLKRRYHRKILLVQNKKNLGYCGGNNSAMALVKKKKAEYVIILNNDAVVDKKLAAKLVEKIKKDKKNALVGATIVDYYHKDKIQCRGFKYNIYLGTNFVIDSGKSIQQKADLSADCISGACFLIRTDLIDSKIFDEDFFCYYEEIDLCLRLIKNGYKTTISPDAYIFHKGEAVTKKIKGFSEYYIVRNRFLVVKKNGNLGQKIIFIILNISLYFVYRIAVLIWQRRFQNIISFVRGYGKGLYWFFIKN